MVVILLESLTSLFPTSVGVLGVVFPARILTPGIHSNSHCQFNLHKEEPLSCIYPSLPFPSSADIRTHSLIGAKKSAHHTTDFSFDFISDCSTAFDIPPKQSRPKATPTKCSTFFYFNIFPCAIFFTKRAAPHPALNLSS